MPKEMRAYSCNVCDSYYRNEEDAKKCEERHFVVKDVLIYNSKGEKVSVIANPYLVEVHFTNGTFLHLRVNCEVPQEKFYFGTLGGSINRG